MNLYNCTKPIENVDSTYKKTSDSLNFYKFSELTEQDESNRWLHTNIYSNK